MFESRYPTGDIFLRWLPTAHLSFINSFMMLVEALSVVKTRAPVKEQLDLPQHKTHRDDDDDDEDDDA